MLIRYIIDLVESLKKTFQPTTSYWSLISSLRHLVGLRPRVYYTLTGFFFGGGGQGPLGHPSSSICQSKCETLGKTHMSEMRAKAYPANIFERYANIFLHDISYEPFTFC